MKIVLAWLGPAVYFCPERVEILKVRPMKRKAQICMMAFILFLAPPLAAAEKDRPSPERLNEYRATGKMQNCVSRMMIDDIEVLSDYVILFHMKDRKVFKNELPYRCFGLGREKRFAYTLSSALLCDDNIITIFSIGPITSSCGLGEFEQLEEIEKAGAEAPDGTLPSRP